MNTSYNLHSLEDSANLSAEIVAVQKRIICLTGDLGAGKTTLSGMIIRKLLANDDLKVKSPTFNILQIYEEHGIIIHHYDLYRVKNLNEALEIGIEESLEQVICIIEWPEVILPIIPKNDVIYIDLQNQENCRTASVIF